MGNNSSAAAVRGRISHHRTGRNWPFLTADADTNVSDFGVGVPGRQEVEFADGSKVWLLRVTRRGVAELFLRELGTTPGGLPTGQIVDLRELVPQIRDDLPIAQTRDVPGVVHFSLRQAFKSVKQFDARCAALMLQEDGQ
ncbi:MAG TPA: hypothetical protein VGE22_12515 [Solimonas sp.]